MRRTAYTTQCETAACFMAQYLLPDGLGAAELSEAFANRLTVERDGLAAAAERTFYDTFDGRVRAAGLAAVYERGRLALVDRVTYVEQAGIELADAPERVLAIELPEGPLREALEPIVEVRALLPVATVRGRRRALRVLNEDAKTVVRLLVDESVVAAPPADGTSRRAPGSGARGAIRAAPAGGARRATRGARGDGGTTRVALRPRLHLLPVRGYDRELAEVRRALEGELGLAAAEAPLQDEAVAAAGADPAGVPSKPAVTLRRDQRTDEAAAAILRALASVIEANLPGTLADVDTEFLHDFRVAVRRSRSLQRQLRRAFPPEPLERFRPEFRWLQQATGPARDLDVYVLEFDRFRDTVGPDLEPLRTVLEAKRRDAHRRMGRALRSARTKRLLAEWPAFLDDFPGADNPDAVRPIAESAGARIRRVYRRMVRDGSAIDDSSPAEALHDLRKQGKELRYLLEFFADLFPTDVVKPMVRTLKSLQDTLGRFQDREVQATTLRGLRDEVAAVENGPAALMAMGLLIERLEAEQAAARAEFAERFAAFAAKPQRRLVKDTFG
jgi:CHAD domain-containing protein